jgi:hypothetical protein
VGGESQSYGAKALFGKLTVITLFNGTQNISNMVTQRTNGWVLGVEGSHNSHPFAFER